MSSKYHKVELADTLDLPEFEGDHTGLGWQSKSLPEAFCLERVRITADGRLEREEWEWKPVPEEERPLYDEEIGGFEHEAEKAFGAMNKIHHGWTDEGHDGVFQFYTTVDETRFKYEAEFTDGTLESITRVE